MLAALYQGAFAQVTAESDTMVTNSAGRNRDLKEVVVTAETAPYRLTKGGVVSKVAGTPLSDAGTCADILKLMPGVRAEDGSIEVIGKGSPQIFINGRRLTDVSEIGRLSSKEVQSVEIINNPGARYGAEVKSVIAIKTVRKRGDGMSGSLQGSDRMGHYLSQAYDLFLNYRSGGVDVFGGVNFDHARFYQSQLNSTVISAGSDNYTLESTTKIYPAGSTWTCNGGMNWQIGPSQYLGMKYEYRATPYSKSLWRGDECVGINGIDVEGIERVTRWDHRSMPTNSLNMYYLGTLGNLTLNMANDYYYRHRNSIQKVMETGSVSGETVAGSKNRTLSSMLASKGSATYRLGDHEIEAGYEVTSTDRKDRAINDRDGFPDSDIRIKETTGAGYLSAIIPIGRCELEGGMRYEHTSSAYYENAVKIYGQSRKYGRLFPDLYFTFPFKGARFTLSYTSKTKRPLYSQLSSSIQYDDRFTYETGNPLLVSEMIHEVSFAGVYKWVFFNASLERSNNAIVSMIRPYEEGKPANIMTYGNFPHLTKYNVVVSLSPKFGRVSPRLRLNLLGQSFEMPVATGVRKADNPMLFWSLYNSVNLDNGFMVNVDITGRTRGDMDVVTLKSSWQINLGMSKNYRDWFFQVQLTDIFRTARNSMVTYGTHMTLDKWNYSDSQAIRLIVRYSWNTALSKYKGKNAGAAERQRL